MKDKAKFGLRIKNYQAAVLYEAELGLRENLDATDAMLNNSLLLDYLKSNGLTIIGGRETRDVICLQFDFGTISYENKMKQLKSSRKKAEAIQDEKKREKRIANLDKHIATATKRQKRFEEHSRNELREIVYRNGISIAYCDEKIHYKVAYRSAGKAKIGQIMAIRDELYDDAIEFLHMGIQLPDENAPIVEMQAYSSLISSAIVGRIKIRPEEILVIPDVERSFITNILSVETDPDNHCMIREIDGYELKNVLFDGQALIDVSIFPEWANDFILLRHHFTKCAAFATRIQSFFRDVFKNDYSTAYVDDYWGRKVKVSDIKLICTDTALKWMKFDVGFEEWVKWIQKNGCEFGIVKTAHESKIGYGYQRASYQMCNSFDLETMDKVVKPAVEYLNWMKADDEFFLHYLESKACFSNDFEVLRALAMQDMDFMNSEYFYERRRSIISQQAQDFKRGKLILPAENLVIVGSPYAMLLASAGLSPDDDPTFHVEDGVIQCYTTRFEDGMYLAGMRSPFNGFYNMTYLHNVYHPLMEKYFAFGKLVVAVNLIKTDFQSRNNGSDQDADFLYVTNQPEVVDQAKYCVKNFPTIENNVAKDKAIYRNTPKDHALVDSKIAAGQMDIGLSSNVCQFCLSYSYNFDDEKYLKYAAILSVLA